RRDRRQGRPRRRRSERRHLRRAGGHRRPAEAEVRALGAGQQDLRGRDPPDDRRADVQTARGLPRASAGRADPALSLTELAFASALEQAALVRLRQVSPLELVELYLERIERLDPQLNAYVT